ncbi:hypothetical protein LP414_26180 [Polaromonas sp. P1(28)-13]|nr:hypothetical protein LP414_26180 [Polaromonas sp. P1(28)-13]
MSIAFTISSTVRSKQHGVSLIIALIALIAMTFAGLALIRAVDTSNVISGNLAFRQASLHATDVGVETALTALGTIVTTSLDANYPASCCSRRMQLLPDKTSCQYRRHT